MRHAALALFFGLTSLGSFACASSPAPTVPPEQPPTSEGSETSDVVEAPTPAPPPEACRDLPAQDCANNGALALLSDTPEQAIELLEWSCGRGVADACSNLAVAYRSERLPAPSAGVVLELDERGCAAGSTQSCRMLGVAYFDGEEIAQDRAKARELFDQGCEADDAKSCFFVGIMLYDDGAGGRDGRGAAAAFERACKLDDAEGCKNAGLLHHAGEAGPRGAYKAASLFEAGCALDDAEACFNIGILLAQGEEVAKDEVAAAKWMARSCELGDQDGCAAAEQLAAAADPNAVRGANLSMGSIEVDGMTITNLQCRLSGGGGGLFGSMALFATLAKKKSAFDKCAPSGAAPVVRWDFVGSKTDVINVEDPSDKVAACVEKIMKKIPATMEAQCRATLLIGNKKGAEAAAAAQ